MSCQLCGGKTKEYARETVGAHIVIALQCTSCREFEYVQLEGKPSSGKPKLSKGKPKADKKGLFLELWRAFAPEGMPEPVYSPEHRFNAPLSGHRFDYAWIEQRVAVEVDGGQFMVTYNAKGQARAGGRHNTDADRHKMNIAARLGWLTFRYTPQMLKKEGEQAIKDVCEALSLRSNNRE